MGSSGRAEEQVRVWYEEYADQMFGFLFVMVGDRQLARDLMQETFLKAFRSFDDFRGDASAKTWLYRIARNEAISYKRKKRPITYLLEHVAPVKSGQPTPEEIVMLGEETAQLYAALFEMKKDYREVIILRKIKEFSTKETATVLGWKESKVKTTLFRAMDELRKRMTEEEMAHEKFKQSN
ncbi:RNA polymerase sigma factor SigX [Bacillus sp. THAF10]|uniref:RNA polymerase sigma factor n=1 Tax=Bacillus sp. THAF10 TaxID=2587848 RepID=UPI0012686E6D|nr:RNA polymerase sigma factor [Bacillus sp. THAF10]QFT90886.1 RNA polymerase sigma factor SigX [Bacillus sp. THAF10]